MGSWADLIKLLVVLALAVVLSVFSRSCGVTAGKAEGEQARADLQAALDERTGELNGCATSLAFANHVVEQEQEEAGRQKALAEQLKGFDVVVTTAAVPGRKAPRIISAATRPGSFCSSSIAAALRCSNSAFHSCSSFSCSAFMILVITLSCASSARFSRRFR